jgi:hypothetical protein
MIRHKSSDWLRHLLFTSWQLPPEHARLPLDISVPMAASQSRWTQMAVDRSQLGVLRGRSQLTQYHQRHLSEIVALPAADAP